MTLERGLLLRRPGAVLGAVLLLIAVDALLWSFFGPDGTPVAPDRVAAGLLAGLGIGCLLWSPGRPRWALECAAAVGILVMTIAMSSRITEQGVISVGVALLMLLVAAATFVPTGHLLVGIGTGLLGLAVGVTANPVPVGGLYVWVLATAIICVPLLVAVLMAELRSAGEAAAEAAVRDPLTGALNRRGVVSEADAVHAVTVRVGTPTAVVAIDLDGFKSVNDSRGHAAGDRVLVDLVAAWTTRLRAGDVLGRLGGDEFLLVLPNTDAASAPAVVERLREAHPFPWSRGIADWDPDEDLDAAIARADVLLYEDKARRAPTVDLRGAAARSAQTD